MSVSLAVLAFTSRMMCAREEAAQSFLLTLTKVTEEVLESRGLKKLKDRLVIRNRGISPVKRGPTMLFSNCLLWVIVI